MGLSGVIRAISHKRRDLMKKAVLAVLVMGLTAGIGTGQAFAQEKRVEFSLNAGVMIVSEDIGVAFSPQLDIHVTKGFMISPEAMVVTDFQFSGALLLPGVLFNYTGRGFFAGAGVVVPVFISDYWTGAGDLLPKLNIGYRGRHVNLTAYLLTSTARLFSENLVGATIGYRF
jgi:hypothetical protein